MCILYLLLCLQMKGLYKGMSAPLMGVTPIFAVCFWAYDLGKQFARSYHGYTSDKQLSLMDIGIAGAFSAVPTTAIMAPGERIKVILQVQDTQPLRPDGKKFAGPGEVVKYLVKTEGIGSVFRGSAATLVRDGSGSFAYFAVYEYIKRTLTPAGQTLSPLAVILGGGFAGVCNWLVALPFDVIKSRIQVNTTAGKRQSMFSVGKELLAEGGVGALYKGAAPALLRAFPANAACFMGMELSKSALDKLF
jgi:solute carrier family 25 carnitine/acylcarnitine transporter 20/29